MSTANDVLVPASAQISDASNVTWSTSLLITYLNLAIKAIINLKPECNPSSQLVTLAAGPIQASPSGCVRILSAICNMGSGGTTPGLAIETLEKEVLNFRRPSWPSDTSNAVTNILIRDKQTPKIFYVWPPNTGGQQIQVVFSQIPANLAATTDTFPLDDIYIPSCVDYLIYRALGDENSIQYSLQKSQLYYKSFMQSLGFMTAQEEKIIAQEEAKPV